MTRNQIEREQASEYTRNIVHVHGTTSSVCVHVIRIAFDTVCNFYMCRKNTIKWDALCLCRLSIKSGGIKRVENTFMTMAIRIKSHMHTVIFSIILITLDNWELIAAQQQPLQQQQQQAKGMRKHHIHKTSNKKIFIYITNLFLSPTSQTKLIITVHVSCVFVVSRRKTYAK